MPFFLGRFISAPFRRNGAGIAAVRAPRRRRKPLSNLPISLKLAIGFACVLLVVAVMSGTLFVALQWANAAARVNGKAAALLDNIDQAAAALFDAANSATSYAVGHGKRNAQLYEAAQKRYADAMAEARANAADFPDAGGVLDRMDAASSSWRDEVGDDAIKLGKDAKSADEALALVRSPMTSSLMESFRGILKPTRAKIDAWSARTRMQQDQAMVVVRIALLAGGVAAIVLSLLIGWALSLLIARPVKAMTAAMNKLAGGDHAVSVPAMDRRDEIGLMAKAVQTFKEMALEKIRVEDEAARERRAAEAARADSERAKAEEARQDQTAISVLGAGLGRLANGDLAHRIDVAFAPKTEKLRNDFNVSVEKLRQTIMIIGENAEMIRMGTDEISSAADDLSQRTGQQVASLEETVASLEEITVTVNKTAESARHARGVVETARSDAERNGAVVRQAIEAMTGIEQSSRQIARIIGVIDEIAFQTNLLALNAGVEAARAGDAGRGFAVVASEVRALAQRSAEAAKEIKSLIQSSTTQVDRGVGLVGETGKALGRIVSQVTEINQLMATIAAGAQEQAMGLNQVNSAVGNMDRATQQNAAMVEETTAAARSLTEKAEELARLVASFDTGAAARQARAEGERRLAAGSLRQPRSERGRHSALSV